MPEPILNYHTKYKRLASIHDEDDLGHKGARLVINESITPYREFCGELPTTEDFRAVIVPADSANDNPLSEVLRVIDEKGIRSLEDDVKAYVDKLTESYTERSMANLPDQMIRKKACELFTLYFQS